MKQTRKKQLAGLLVLALLLGLCACGGSKTPEEVIAKAGENLAGAKSMTFDMAMKMGMSAGDETVDVTMTLNGETTTEPAIVHADMNIDMGGFGAIAMEMYAEQSDSTVATYIGVDPGSGLTWMKEETALDEASAILDARGDMGSSLALAANLKEIGTETVSGVETTRYDGVITKENLHEMMENNGMLDELGDTLNLKQSLEEAAEDTEALSDVPISIWIDKEAMLPVKYEMDMTEMMQSLMAQVSAAVSMEYPTVSGMKISMTIGGIDTVEAITIPDEARNAESLS